MRNKLFATFSAVIVVSSAHAQSNAVLYGLIDAGVSYANHSRTTDGNSGKLFKYDDGVAQGSRWGVRGSEDLGGGMRALFVLENGFNGGTGTLGQGGALFGRQAFVGLSRSDLGTLTFGRQYSMSTDVLGKYSTGTNTVAGNYGYHVNDIDQLGASRINNSVKFQSTNYAGFSFGILYGFSNQAGAFAGSPGTSGSGPAAGSSRTYSFGLNYANGPFAAGAAYTDIRFPSQAGLLTTIANVNIPLVRKLRSYGVGSSYTQGRAMAWLLWTNTRLESLTGQGLTYNAYEAGGKYAVTPALTGTLSYTYSRLSDSRSGHWNMASASVDYALSKRTDIYLLGVYQQASGHGIQAQIGLSPGYFNTSGLGSKNQTVARIGIRHKF
ncbi:porin [Burkholderia cepacia]|uniref:porin n=1 Tax=Burkholderia cepacia TaxID=292 RepID=UPI002AB7CE73|nr:porin [Burkholderia cepacia]